MSLISEGNGKYRLEIGGPDPISSVPIFTVKKMSEKLDVHKISSNNLDLLTDELELEQLLEPGFFVKNEIKDAQQELQFIRGHKDIPENLKKKLLDCLENIPSLYSGEEFSSDTFPKDIFVWMCLDMYVCVLFFSQIIVKL